MLNLILLCDKLPYLRLLIHNMFLSISWVIRILQLAVFPVCDSMDRWSFSRRDDFFLIYTMYKFITLPLLIWSLLGNDTHTGIIVSENVLSNNLNNPHVQLSICWTWYHYVKNYPAYTPLICLLYECFGSCNLMSSWITFNCLVYIR